MGNLLWVVAVVLVVLWALGFAMNFTMGGLIHVLLILAIVVVLFRIISGRQAV
ncbi:MAG: lmo0937 family membrane protein [Myxococcaceae bacterium]